MLSGEWRKLQEGWGGGCWCEFGSAGEVQRVLDRVHLWAWRLFHGGEQAPAPRPPPPAHQPVPVFILFLFLHHLLVNLGRFCEKLKNQPQTTARLPPAAVGTIKPKNPK